MSPTPRGRLWATAAALLALALVIACTPASERAKPSTGVVAATAWPSVAASPDPVGHDRTIPTRWPIEHVVVIMQENQSFDHLFGRFPGVDGTRFGWDHGVRVPLTHLTAQRIPDLPHCWTCAVASWNGGKMDGFDQSAISRTYAYTQYKRTDEPNYWAWAERYVLDAAVHRGELGAEAAHAARRERAEPPSGLRLLAEAGAPPSPPAPNGLHRPEVADHVVR